MTSWTFKLAVPLLVALGAVPSAAEEERREVEHFWLGLTTLGYTPLSTMTIGVLGVAVGMEGHDAAGGTLVLTSLASGIVIGSKIGGTADRAADRVMVSVCRLRSALGAGCDVGRSSTSSGSRES